MTEPPVLLVHGFASSFERNWREPGWVDILRDEGREVIGFDFLGHGTAEKPHDPAAYGHLDEALMAALPHHTAVDAVGFSMGAQQLLRVASEHPDRFRRLVVAGVGANLFQRVSMEAAAKAIETGETRDGDPAVAQAFATFARAPGNDGAALAACLRRSEPALEPAQLKGVTVPVLVVLGDKDFAGPADPLLDALPDARLVSLRGADHFGTPKDFRFIEAAVDFLRG